MLKTLSFLLIFATSTHAFSRTCSENLKLSKKTSYFSRLSEDNQQLIAFGSTVGGLAVGLSVASAAFPAFIIAASIASSPILIGDAIKGIQNRPINRMIKLIDQSEKLIANPDSKPGRLLRKVHAKLEDQKLGSDISILELAMSISDANQNPEQCSKLNRIKNIDDEIMNGALPVIELDSELDA